MKAYLISFINTCIASIIINSAIIILISKSKGRDYLSYLPEIVTSPVFYLPSILILTILIELFYYFYKNKRSLILYCIMAEIYATIHYLVFTKLNYYVNSQHFIILIPIILFFLFRKYFDQKYSA